MQLKQLYGKLRTKEYHYVLLLFLHPWERSGALTKPRLNQCIGREGCESEACFKNKHQSSTGAYK